MPQWYALHGENKSEGVYVELLGLTIEVDEDKEFMNGKVRWYWEILGRDGYSIKSGRAKNVKDGKMKALNAFTSLLDKSYNSIDNLWPHA